MKQVCCVIAGVCCLYGGARADEAGMQNALSEWNIRQSDWESAFKTAETAAKRTELLKSQPDAVAVAGELWRQMGRDVRASYAIPAIAWLLEHPQAIAKAFPTGDTARKIVMACLDSLEKNLKKEQGVGQVAFALSISRDVRCRSILEKIRNDNPFQEDQGLAALGLAMIMKENTGMFQDDPRLVNARGRLLQDAIIKCYDSRFGPVPVRDVLKEELYEIRNLNIGQPGPRVSLPSSSTGMNVNIPMKDKKVMLVFWDPRDAVSAKFLAKAASLRTEFPELTVLPVAPLPEQDVKDALLNLNLDIPSLIDEKAVAFKDYRVMQTPFVYVFDPAGKVLMRGMPDMLFDAHLYGVMNRKAAGKGPVRGQAPAAASMPEPSAVRPVAPAPPRRSPAVRQPAPAPAPSAAPALRPMPDLDAPPLRPMPE